MSLSTRVVEVDPRDLKLLDINPRYMKSEMFANLVANIQRDGVLTQLPFCAKADDGRWEVLSGNHRVKAAIQAGLERIQVLVTDDELPHKRRVAIQLSHNAIAGEDDPVILKELYEQLDDVAERMYSGLDDRTLALLDAVNLESLSEANLTFTTVTLLFLPDEVDRVKQVLDDAMTLVSGSQVWTARFGDYDAFMESVQLAQSSWKVGNVATAVTLLVEIVRRHLTDFQEGWLDESGEAKHKGWVALETILGDKYMPAESAALLKRALDRMVADGDVSRDNLARGLEFLAVEYLNTAREDV